MNKRLLVLCSVSLAVSTASLSAEPKVYKFPKAKYEVIPNPEVGQAVDMRCGSDQIGTNEQALKRINWADGCSLVKKKRLFTEVYDDDTATWNPRAKFLYPMFTHTDADFKVWSPTSESCTVPDDIIYFSNCEAGCYRGDQVVSFGEGDFEIGDVVNGKIPVKTVRTLTSDSSLDAISFQEQKIQSFSRSVQDAKEPLLHFKTAQGGNLVVTLGHPLVNQEGLVVEAAALKVGDSLVRDNGQLDAITSIERDETFFGKTYNVAPVGFGYKENIVVGQGFLNGSTKFQKLEVKELGRLSLRDSVPANLI